MMTSMREGKKERKLSWIRPSTSWLPSRNMKLRTLNLILWRKILRKVVINRRRYSRGSKLFLRVPTCQLLKFEKKHSISVVSSQQPRMAELGNTMPRNLWNTWTISSKPKMLSLINCSSRISRSRHRLWKLNNKLNTRKRWEMILSLSISISCRLRIKNMSRTSTSAIRNYSPWSWALARPCRPWTLWKRSWHKQTSSSAELQSILMQRNPSR